MLVSSPFTVVEVSDDRYRGGRDRTTMNLHLQPVSGSRKFESTHASQVQGEGQQGFNTPPPQLQPSATLL
jgi:hypothetical protein